MPHSLLALFIAGLFNSPQPDTRQRDAREAARALQRRASKY